MTCPSAKPLGQLLVEAGRISAADLDKALQFQAEYGGRLGGVLTRLGVCSEEALLPILAAQLGVAFEADAPQPSPEAVAQAVEQSGLPAEWFGFRRLIPWLDEAGTLHVASRHPADPLVMELLDERNLAPQWHLVGTQTEAQWLTLLIAPRAGMEGDAAYLRELAEEAPVVSLVNNILTQAVELDASDIHLEPDHGTLRVRYRIDGILVDRLRTSATRLEAVISRIKLMAHLDIAERRLPQDGRLSFHAAGQAFDVRVSSLPGAEGESVVMRLLPKDQARLNLDVLGLTPDLYVQMKHVANQPHGMMLVTGPTGSGKSTTLYALLGELNNGERKIITVEDPVEYKVTGVTQVQTHAEIGYDFARALRAILRQDPDVIMIGEIRDSETARIAVQASLTGHTVLSTLHTNDAVSAFGRLIDMGVEPYLLASAVRGVLAQRLVRRLCPHCRAPAEPPAGLAPLFHELRARFSALMSATPRLFAASGCRHCHGTGYSGRVGIHEWVEVGADMAHLIAQSAPVAALRQTLAANFRTLREDGLIKAWNGETSLDEVFRVTGAMAESETDVPVTA